MRYRLFLTYILIIILSQFLVSLSGQEVDLAIQTGHTDGIEKLAFSNDNHLLASVDKSGNFIIWDLVTGKQLFLINNLVSDEIKFDNDNNKIFVKKGDKYFEIDILKTIVKLVNQENTVYGIKESTDSSYSYKIHGYWIEGILKKPVPKRIKLLSDYIDKDFTDVRVSIKNNLLIATNRDSKIYIKSFSNNLYVKKIKQHLSAVNCVELSPDESLFATGSDDRSIIIWDIKTLKPIKRLFTKVYHKTSVCFSKNGKYIAFGDETGGVCILSLAFPRINFQYKILHQDVVSDIKFIQNDKYIVTTGYDNNCIISKVDNLEPVKIFKLKSYFGLGKWFEKRRRNKGYQVDSKIKIDQVQINNYYLTLNGRKKVLDRSYSFFSFFFYSLVDKNISKTFLFSDLGLQPENIDESKFDDKDALKFYFPDTIIQANDFDLNSSGKILATCHNDGTVKLWDVVKRKLMVSILFNNQEVMLFSPDNFYMGDKGLMDGVAFKIGKKALPAEQFDLKYNRPDIVLHDLQIENTNLIRAYHQAYLKRLKKSGFTEEMLKGDLHLPEVKVINSDKVPLKTNVGTLDMSIEAKDTLYPINSINVWINGVPLFGRFGKKIQDSQEDIVKQDILLKLSPQNNIIQISCLNQKGVESLKATYNVFFDTLIRKPDLYLIPISVSHYQDNNMNLQYAAKDGKDIVGLFKQENKKYNAIHVDSLFDKNAVIENVLALKQLLKKTKINDIVIVFISGHGLLDDNFNFYFASQDINFNKPTERGIPYELLEDILDSIPARQKLLLIDACHSGEVDKEEIEVKNNLTAQKGLKGDIKEYVYKAGTLQIDTVSIGLENSFELMTEVFSNLNKGSGTVVISAAAGKGYALESEKWNNGVFTYSLIDGLRSGKADINNDKKIMVLELRDYIIKSVYDLTNGKQRPTSRQENKDSNFKIW